MRSTFVRPLVSSLNRTSQLRDRAALRRAVRSIINCGFFRLTRTPGFIQPRIRSGTHSGTVAACTSACRSSSALPVASALALAFVSSSSLWMSIRDSRWVVPVRVTGRAAATSAWAATCRPRLPVVSTPMASMIRRSRGFFDSASTIALHRRSSRFFGASAWMRSTRLTTPSSDRSASGRSPYRASTIRRMSSGSRCRSSAIASATAGSSITECVASWTSTRATPRWS